MKNILLKILKCCVFILLAAALLLSTQQVMISTTDVGITSDYFRTDEKTDIILVGPSTVIFGLYPAVLWDSYGFTSYDLGTGSQSMGISYYLLKEVMKQNKPELVILDCGRAYKNEKVASTSYLHYVSDNMPLLSKNRIDMISDLSADFTKEEQMALYIPMIGYHTRWKELNKTDFESNEKAESWGARVSAAVDFRGLYDEPEINTENALGETALGYLEQIVDLCKENGTELLLITMPLISQYKNISQNEYAKRINGAYALEEFAAERGVQYLNLIDKGPSIGLVPETDSKDGLHINYDGAMKMTAYLGDYIQSHFDLRDHRNEAGYESFQKDYEAYLDYLPEGALRSANTLDGYLRWLERIKDDPRYEIIITDTGKGSLRPFKDYKDSFAKLGIRTDHAAGSITVIDGGEIREEIDIEDVKAFADERARFHYINDETGLKISLFPDDQAVVIKGTNYIEGSFGFHIVVYDKEQKDIADCIGVDTEYKSYYLKHYTGLNTKYNK